MNGHSTLLKLEGALRDAWLAAVEQGVKSVKSEKPQPRFDLADATFADAAGIALLGEMLKGGDKIFACLGFIAVSLGREKP